MCVYIRSHAAEAKMAASVKVCTFLLSARLWMGGKVSWIARQLLMHDCDSPLQPVLYSYFRSSCSWRVRAGEPVTAHASVAAVAVVRSGYGEHAYRPMYVYKCTSVLCCLSNFQNGWG